eukprot:CAMPEP_0185903452 /NCGR_PEP_ID=MMETSP0196C-20130402/2693_1 /TAXON_ID=2932 /ORGANISM="Alexandrium fundyense, Strain CCMP1719" /LENGTH=47 /DNA_ID= /DNA_START= /DNA_END= /DNA_ORIENTATION=
MACRSEMFLLELCGSVAERTSKTKCELRKKKWIGEEMDTGSVTWEID